MPTPSSRRRPTCSRPAGARGARRSSTDLGTARPARLGRAGRLPARRRRPRAARTTRRRRSSLETPASSIGLEPYRELCRAEALELGGPPRRRSPPRALQRVPGRGSFAYRVRAATVLARSARKDAQEPRRRRRCSRSPPTPPPRPAETRSVAIARIRLGLALHDSPRPCATRRAPSCSRRRPPTPTGVLPAFARSAAAEAERSLTPADRGRRGSALVAAGRPASRGPSSPSRSAFRMARGRAHRETSSRSRGAKLALKKARDAEATAARIPDDGTVASAEARLLRCDLVLARAFRRPGPSAPPKTDAASRAGRAGARIPGRAGGAGLRCGAARRSGSCACAVEADDFDAALAHARTLTDGTPEHDRRFRAALALGLEALSRGRLRRGARARFETISRSLRGRLAIAAGSTTGARAVSRSRAGVTKRPQPSRSSPRRAPPTSTPSSRGAMRAGASTPDLAPLGDPSTATAAYARVDELLRLRRFEEAVAEARTPARPRRGRDLRLAQADLRSARFSTAALAIKRALPEIGTAEEGRVPGELAAHLLPDRGGRHPRGARARVRCRPGSVLRGLVRQESVFDARVKSHAGAVGLMQLMPPTARSLSRRCCTRATAAASSTTRASTPRSARRT